MERLLTVEQAAPYLGAQSDRMARRLIAQRRIRFVRVGRNVRIPESAIIEYVKANTVEPLVRGRAA
jgi:excisionase family DNA binding protein